MRVDYGEVWGSHRMLSVVFLCLHCAETGQTVILVSRLVIYIHHNYRSRDAEGWKKEASKVKQTTRQSNTAHPRQSLFLRNMSCLYAKTKVAKVPRGLISTPHRSSPLSTASVRSRRGLGGGSAERGAWPPRPRTACD